MSSNARLVAMCACSRMTALTMAMSKTEHHVADLPMARLPQRLFEMHPHHAGSMADVWLAYVADVYRGAPGRDGNDRIVEKFGVILAFPAGAPFDLHPEMDAEIHRRYVKKLMTTEADEELGGSYGRRLRTAYVDAEGRPIDQIAVAVRALKERPATKTSVANLLHPPASSIEQDLGSKRTACLTSIQWLLRDGVVAMLANFRSQNAANAHGNFGALHELHKEVVSHLGQGHTLGELVVVVAAAHLYECDFARAARIAAIQ